MSTVLDRVTHRKGKIYQQAITDLATKNLSEVLRSGTWPDHERARHSDFEMSLVNGTVPEDAYRDFMGQTYFIYCALEDRAQELKDDPIAGRVIFPELNRRGAIEEDLAYYYGPDWREQIDQLPVTEEYAERIRDATPRSFVAHHYTRYLADLSGGFMIYEGLKKSWGRDTEGLRYYLFPEVKAFPFKKRYRQILDELPLTVDEKWEVIEESLVAYEFNVEIVRQLAERYLIPSQA
jgi:heme oxygenase